MSATTYTPEQARADFKGRLRYGQARDLADRFGVSATVFRLWVETRDGKPPLLSKIVYERTTRAYYDRETLINIITTHL